MTQASGREERKPQVQAAPEPASPPLGEMEPERARDVWALEPVKCQDPVPQQPVAAGYCGAGSGTGRSSRPRPCAVPELLNCSE